MILAVVLGATAGFLVWGLLWIMNMGIDLIWEIIPEYTGHKSIYTIIVCLLGGLLIGLWQKKYGIYPEELETVLHKLRKDGTYSYNKIPILCVAALLPLIFGGCLGPEAGLTGIIVGLCCWVSDRLKYKAKEVRQLAEAGMAATLGVVFNSPFVGIAFNLEEPDTADSKGNESLQDLKKLKVAVYVASVAGALGIMMLLNHLTGGGGGLPRFSDHGNITFSDWKWFPVLFAAGLAAGCIYVLVHKLTCFIGDKLKAYRVLSCMLAGLLLAVIGIVFPWTMFSGEHQMAELMEVWQEESPLALIITAVMKLILVNLCINLGWKGGHIFPVIFSGVSLGYAMAIIIGIEPIFAVAVCTAVLCGYVMRKPLMVIGVLLLCFPITLIIPLCAAAYCGSIIPLPGNRK